MQPLKYHVQALVQQVYTDTFPECGLQISVEYCDIQFGHFATNAALASAKLLGKSPMEIGQSLADALNFHPDLRSVEVQAPGFVNMQVCDELLVKYLKNTEENPREAIGNMGQGKTMVIDYSHPNIGKPMGVHHLLSTIIGDSIKRLYREVGYTVIADNFIGDMGTQFGKLIHAVKTWGDMEAIERNPVPELLKLYVHFHIAADSDDDLDDAGRAEYKKLEDGDLENRALLTKIQEWSKAEMFAVYDMLGVEFDYMNGESFYENKMQPIIDQGIDRGIFVKSQGALVCKLDNPDDPPAIIQKSDGATLYLTRDLAQKAYWEQTWHPDIMLFVVDVAQSLQLSQVFEVATKLGLTKAKMVHAPFGRMMFRDAGMSTRKGNIILVEDLITEAKKRVAQQIVSLSKDLSETEQDKLRDILAINAIKYTILHQNRLSTLNFDWDSILSLDGQSAPYLAYSVVRMKSIMQKASTSVVGVATDSIDLDSQERELILELTRLPIVFEQAVRQFQPSDIAHYAYHLSRLYNSYYHSHQIIIEGTVDPTRLLLNKAVLEVITLCFDVLGMKLPNKM